MLQCVPVLVNPDPELFVTDPDPVKIKEQVRVYIINFFNLYLNLDTGTSQSLVQ